MVLLIQKFNDLLLNSYLTHLLYGDLLNDEMHLKVETYSTVELISRFFLLDTLFVFV